MDASPVVATASRRRHLPSQRQAILVARPASLHPAGCPPGPQKEKSLPEASQPACSLACQLPDDCPPWIRLTTSASLLPPHPFWPRMRHAHALLNLQTSPQASAAHEQAHRRTHAQPDLAQETRVPAAGGAS